MGLKQNEKEISMRYIEWVQKSPVTGNSCQASIKTAPWMWGSTLWIVVRKMYY